MAGTEITVTQSAAQEIRNLMTQEGYQEEAFLRIGVKEGGCSGLSYIMHFDTSKSDNDQIFECAGIKIVCDSDSFFSLAGIELDYQGGLGGQGFMFKNPNARMSCGCGKSFS